VIWRWEAMGEEGWYGAWKKDAEKKPL